MRNAWSWLGLNLGKRAGSVAVIGLAVTLLLGLGITQLQFRTSNASYLNANDKAQIENQNYENLFGGDPIAAMFTMAPGSTIDDLFTQHNITEFQAVQRQLTADPSVFSVITPLDSITLAQSLSTSPDGNPTSSLAGQLLLYGEESTTRRRRARRRASRTSRACWPPTAHSPRPSRPSPTPRG
jgi:predicted RND superfamily exporter protein